MDAFVFETIAKLDDGERKKWSECVCIFLCMCELNSKFDAAFVSRLLIFFSSTVNSSCLVYHTEFTYNDCCPAGISVKRSVTAL